MTWETTMLSEGVWQNIRGNKAFLSLIRFAIQSEKTAPQIEPDLWQAIYDTAERQALSGLLFYGIQKLKEENRGEIKIPRDILFNLFFIAEQIKQRNLLLNKKCVELTKQLQNDSFECCILKGQGNATMYPESYVRAPGDIDIWVITRSGLRCKKDKVIDYARGKCSKIELRYYHIEYEYDGIPVELHFTPGIMNNPWYNNRLQKWYNQMADGGWLLAELPEGVGRIPVPTKEFNIVFQLAHMMHHFFDEGIGLRQMIDYYFLLKARNDDGRCKMEDVRETLKYLNLDKFAGAVMYIMKEVLGLEERYLIVPVDERRGKTLLNEILKGGNFGHHSGLAQNNAAKKYFQKTWRNMQLVKEYPEEALCEPFFRTWHYFWRMIH